MAVRFHGRVVDPVALWAAYVDFPSNFDGSDGDEFAPLVKCPNPDHQTEKRHFQVNMRKDLVHCFANCGISGTYEHAISLIEGVTHREARKRILKHSRIGKLDHAPKRRRGVPEKPQTVQDNRYETYIPHAGLNYLEKIRGITSESISKWELGWDSDQLRIVIPAKDERGRTQFLIRRAVKDDQHPRYLYPQDSERNRLLFGSCFIDPGMLRSRGLVLVEGSLDVIVSHQNEITYCEGILGSRLSRIQARKIMNQRPARIFTMFDADGAGIDATYSVAKLIHGIPIFVCRYPKGKTDPAELTKKEQHRMLERAIPFSHFNRLVVSRNPKVKRELKKVG